MTPRLRRRPRPGFTLLEVTVVMVALGVLMALGAELIVAALRADAVGAAADARATLRGELAREFRRDVAGAESAPDKLGDVAAGPDRMILQMPGGAAVVYEWGETGLTRTERGGDGDARRALPLGPGRPRVEFARPKDGLVTLRLVESPKAGPARVTDLSAALGRDLR
ncbi:prepilin-type N-terminal cleavage/methylation domain-containing protein [bacterium]|mgnify:CR=1 FL=1|nr:prepilin-type N-terminal cleavage/methylation domain-containing protein [bacterium]